MSTGETQYAEEVKAEVRQAIRQLSELSRSEVQYDEFCQTVLDKIVKLTGSHGALLWQLNGTVPVASHRAAGQQAEKIAPVAKEHSDLVAEVIGAEQAGSRSSKDLPSANEGGAEAIKYLMLFAPIFNSQKKCNGAIELLQRHDISNSAREGYLRFLAQIAQLFARFHEHRDLTVLSKSAEKWNEQMGFVTEVHRTIDTHETVYAIANETRRLLNSDRVSVANWNGSNCNIEAISSQDRFDNRSNVVKKLARVASASVSAETPFWIVGETEGLAPEVARRINDYLDEAHSRTLIVLPLFSQPPKVADLEMQNQQNIKPKKLGALVVEYFDADVREDDIREDMKMVVKQSELALANSREHSEIFLLPIWQRLGWVQKMLFRDHKAKTITGLSILGVLILAMIIVPWQLKMKVDGVIHPKLRRDIFSQTEAVIKQVHVKENEQVTEGQPLLQMENTNLNIEIANLESELEILGKQVAAMNMQFSSIGLTDEDAMKLSASLETFRKQQEFKKRNLEIKKDERDRLKITSPINGTIMTWNFETRLKDLPVRPNQVVMSVADKNGDWELELKIPQNKIGYVTKAMSESSEPLDVEFVVGTNANVKVFGELVRIADRAELSDSGIPEFRAIVKVNKEDLKGVRPGAGVTAKIRCGRERLGFVWFHQIIDFLRTRVFF